MPLLSVLRIKATAMGVISGSMVLTYLKNLSGSGNKPHSTVPPGIVWVKLEREKRLIQQDFVPLETEPFLLRQWSNRENWQSSN